MDWLLNHWAELGAVVSTLWGARERLKRSRAEKARVAAEAVKDVWAAQAEARGRIGERFADALARGDLKAMREIEAERKARGL